MQQEEKTPQQSDKGVIKNVLLVWKSVLSIISNTFLTIGLEVKLAKKSLFTLVYLFFICFILMITAWLFGMIALTLWLFTIGFSMLSAFLMVSGLNIALIGCILIYAYLPIQHLKFKSSRRQINQLFNNNI